MNADDLRAFDAVVRLGAIPITREHKLGPHTHVWREATAQERLDLLDPETAMPPDIRSGSLVVRDRGRVLLEVEAASVDLMTGEYAVARHVVDDLRPRAAGGGRAARVTIDNP